MDTLLTPTRHIYATPRGTSMSEGLARNSDSTAFLERFTAKTRFPSRSLTDLDHLSHIYKDLTNGRILPMLNRPHRLYHAMADGRL